MWFGGLHMTHFPSNFDVIEFSLLETLWARKLKVQKTHLKIINRLTRRHLLLSNSWMSMFTSQSMQNRCTLITEGLGGVSHTLFPIHICCYYFAKLNVMCRKIHFFSWVVQTFGYTLMKYYLLNHRLLAVCMHPGERGMIDR